MSTRRGKLSYALKGLPVKEQKAFSKALLPHNFNLEMYVPKNFNNKRAVITDKNCLRNKLVEFNDMYKAERNVLDQLKKETTEFSKNYKVVNYKEPGKEISQRLELYGELISKYKEQGYNEKNLFPKENIFEPSILLKDEGTFENVYLLSNIDDFKGDANYIQNVNSYIASKKNTKDFTKKSKSARNMNDEESDLFEMSINKSVALPKLSNKKMMMKTNRDLRHEIRNTEKLINVTQSTNFDMTNQTSSMHFQTFASTHSKRMVTEDIFLSSKGMKRSAQKRKGKSPQRIRKRVLALSPEKKKEEMIISQKRKIRDLNTVYEKMSTGQFKRIEKDLIKYLIKYKKKLPEPLK